MGARGFARRSTANRIGKMTKKPTSTAETTARRRFVQARRRRRPRFTPQPRLMPARRKSTPATINTLLRAIRPAPRARTPSRSAIAVADERESRWLIAPAARAGSATTIRSRGPAPSTVMATRSDATGTRKGTRAAARVELRRLGVVAEASVDTTPLRRRRLHEAVAAVLVRLRVGGGVVECVECWVAGDREQEPAVVELVDDLDADFVRAGIPEEGHLEAVLVAVGQFSEGCVRHRGSFPVGDLRLQSPIMRRGRCRSRPGRPHSYP